MSRPPVASDGAAGPRRVASQAVTAQIPGNVLDSDPLARVGQLAGVAEAVARARSGVDALLRHKMLRRRSAEVTTEASLRSARASASLDGHDVPLDLLRSRLTTTVDGPDGESGSGDTVPAEVLASVRLYGELGTLSSSWERAPRQALARMHMLVARGLVPDVQLGRPREVGQRHLDDPLGLGDPPSPMEAQARLDGLTKLLVGRTSAPAVVVAAVVHAELLALRPFGSFDGVVARAAGRLVLISRGLDPKAVTTTDVGHVEAGTAADHSDRDVARYADAAHAYAAGGVAGVRSWIAHYARAVELGARESLAICEALDRAG